jgi:hypothetical protein
LLVPVVTEIVASKFTVPANPESDWADRLNVAVEPACMVMLCPGAEIATENPLTTRETGADRAALPLLPTMVSAYVPGLAVAGTFTVKPVMFVVESAATVIDVVLKATVAPAGRPVTSEGEKVTVPLKPEVVVPVIVTGAVVAPALAVRAGGWAERAKSATTSVVVIACEIPPLLAVTGTA